MRRIVVPEILDSLPADHPEALRSRRDLVRINRLMGSLRWIERQVRAQDAPGPLLEIGAGEGDLCRELAKVLPGQVTGLDLAARPADLPSDVGWVQADVFSEEAGPVLASARTVVANLVLHHFQPEELQELGGRLHSAERIIVSEPARRRRHLWAAWLIAPWVGRVTRHDMFVSIRAGFRGDDLPQSLGLGDRWEWRSECGPLGACRLVARRRA